MGRAGWLGAAAVCSAIWLSPSVVGAAPNASDKVAQAAGATMPPARPSDLPGVEGAERPAPKTLKAIKPDAAGRKAARAGDAPKDADLETPADAGRPDRPGSFGNQSVRVPGPFHRKNTVASHTKKPDLELGGDGRTTLGVFGNADLMDKTDLRNSTSKSVRDVGAGLTLQYRFGQ